MADTVPAARPYFVLSVTSTTTSSASYRRPGHWRSTGFICPVIASFSPSFQTQGIVAVMSPPVAGVVGGLALSGLDPVASWIVGAVLFVATLVGLMAYWRRSVGQIRASIRPMYPTPAEAVDELI